MRKVIFAVALAALLAGCATGPTVKVLSDPEANFSQYRTFAFAQPLGTDRNGYKSQVSTALMASTRREMEARGFVFTADNPQLLVNFNAALNDRVRVSTTTEPTMGELSMRAGYGYGYYGYRGGLYSAYPVYRDSTTVSQYKEGTLNVDVADAAAQRLVWEGIVTQKFTESSYIDVAPTIDVAITAAFAKFPVKPRN
jgi:hypothetical protein